MKETKTKNALNLFDVILQKENVTSAKLVLNLFKLRFNVLIKIMKEYQEFSFLYETFFIYFFINLSKR